VILAEADRLFELPYAPRSAGDWRIWTHAAVSSQLSVSG